MAIAHLVSLAKAFSSDGSKRTSQIPPVDGVDSLVSATFNYAGAALGEADHSAVRTSFEAGFYDELESVRAWSIEAHWEPVAVSDVQVFVSAEYKISRALVYAWRDRPGRMEFPAWRVVAGKAAIAHELAHVFFPNSNRFLAEGLAVYLQFAIGGNSAFPNFGRPLHELASHLLQDIVSQSSLRGLNSLEQVRLSELDEIATPSPLKLRVGQDLYGEEPRGQARIYSIAGSFTQFLIETRRVERFHMLYKQTPLLPLTQNAGMPDRWLNIYGVSLSDLASEWKSMIMGGDLSTFGKDNELTADRTLK